MRPPEFWRHRGFLSGVLLPVSWIYEAVGTLRRRRISPWKAPVPVLCIGNLTTGGTGKTPVAIALAEMLKERGRSPHFLSRGYGGSVTGPARVDPERHTAKEVGDEPLLLSRTAPVWIGGNRAATAKLACDTGADCLVMDDGFQNPGLAKDYSVIVIDGPYGLGNGRVLPAGPLRESLRAGTARAQAVILIGEDEHSISAKLDLPVIRADIAPLDIRDLAGEKFAAFAGIGRPGKFFESLRAMNCNLISERAFPDHHEFSAREIREILALADKENATAITTEKDLERIPTEFRVKIDVLRVGIRWRDAAAPGALLEGLLADG